MGPVGHASKACNACRRSALETGWALTKDVAAASPKTAGAICRQASQSMQVESTKKSPGTFSGIRFLGFAMIEPPVPSFYRHGLGVDALGPGGRSIPSRIAKLTARRPGIMTNFNCKGGTDGPATG